MNVDIEDNLLYKPKTKENRLLYEQILSKIHICLGDESQEVLKSVTDEVLAELKIDNKKDIEKKVEIEAMIGKITTEFFSELLNLSKQINDYAPEAEENVDKLEEEMRVAFVFDEDGNKDEEDSEENNVKDYESEDDNENELKEGDIKAIKTLKNNDESMEDSIIDKYNIEVSQLEPYWLQTELNKHFNDPVVAQRLEQEIMKALISSNDIECENRLVGLLTHTKFELIKLLLKNRHKIYYCTKLGRSQVINIILIYTIKTFKRIPMKKK